MPELEQGSIDPQPGQLITVESRSHMPLKGTLGLVFIITLLSPASICSQMPLMAAKVVPCLTRMM
jgi:hypothetical protein